MARDPARYRLLILPAIGEKWLFSASSVMLMMQGRTAVTFAFPVAIDFILGILFLVSFIKTRNEKARA